MPSCTWSGSGPRWPTPAGSSGAAWSLPCRWRAVSEPARLRRGAAGNCCAPWGRTPALACAARRSNDATTGRRPRSQRWAWRRDESSRCRQLATMPGEHFETAVATAKATAGEVATAFMLREAMGDCRQASATTGEWRDASAWASGDDVQCAARLARRCKRGGLGRRCGDAGAAAVVVAIGVARCSHARRLLDRSGRSGGCDVHGWKWDSR